MTDERKNGLIVKGVGGLYTVLSEDGEYRQCRARGIFRYENISPLVGDRVTFETDGKERGDTDGFVIDSILPRRNSLVRPSVANLSHLFVIVPSAKPKPDLLTVDKIIAVAESKEIEPVIIVNKSDIAPEETDRIRMIYTGAGFTCMAVSAKTGDGCEELLDYFERNSEKNVMTAALAGASAAGKSTLMKKLFPVLDLKTGEISRKTERGRHTTRHVELFPVLEGRRCFIADTPGFSLLDFTRYNFCELSELAYNFREFRDCLGKCRYTKCTHTKEEGCAVLEKVSSGGISVSRHENYSALFAEIKSIPEWKRKKALAENS